MSGAITATAVIAASLTATEIFTAVAVVGAAVGVIGTVTHVKELQYAGMALGAVGAVGGLAASAGLFAADAFGSMSGSALGEVAGGTTLAETASPFGGVAGVGGGGMEGVLASGLPGATAGLDGVANIPGPFDPGTNTPDLISMATGQYTGPGAALPPNAGGLGAGGGDAVAPSVTPAVANDGTQVAQAAPAAANPPPAATGAPQPAAGGGVETAPAPSIINGTPNGPGSGTVMVGGQPVTAAPPPNPPWTPAEAKALPGSLPDAEPSIWSKILDIAGKPGVGMLGFGAIQAGSAFIAGATSSLTPAQVKALQAQSDYNVAAANLANQQSAVLQNQQANLTGGIPAAVKPTPPPTGMINNAPPKLAPVTGVPA